MTEAYDLVACFQFGNADEFSDQRFADEEQFALPHDLAVAAHTPHLVIGIIPRVLKALWHGARRCRIELGGQSLIQRLVRALLVVVSAEVVKADLLFGPACCRRARGLRLERAMHPLVATVFLRRCRTDEMRLDTELEPPRRELGQPAGPARAERRAIVAADRNWQAVAAKRCAEGWPNPIDRRRHDIERDQKAAVVVRYGQGVNARAVSGAKPALEIDTPFVIDDLDSCKWPLLSKWFAPPLGWSDLARLLQVIPNGRGRRPAVLRMAPLQHRQELAGSQMRNRRRSETIVSTSPGQSDADSGAAHAIDR